jgi:hypothetical protein
MKSMKHSCGLFCQRGIPRYFLFIIAFALAAILFYNFAKAQTLEQSAIERIAPIMTRQVNPMFAEISNDEADAGMTQEQKNFSNLYGRLDYMARKIDALEQRIIAVQLSCRK